MYVSGPRFKAPGLILSEDELGSLNELCMEFGQSGRHDLIIDVLEPQLPALDAAPNRLKLQALELRHLLAVSYAWVGDVESAERTFRKNEELAKEGPSGINELRIKSLRGLVFLYGDTGLLSDARRLQERAIEVASSLDVSPWTQMLLHLEAADLSRIAEQDAAAEDHYERALSIEELPEERQPFRIEAFIRVSEIHLNKGEIIQAQLSIAEAQEIAMNLWPKRSLEYFEFSLSVARVLTNARQFKLGEPYYQELDDFLDTHEIPPNSLAAEALAYCALYLEMSDRRSDAIGFVQKAFALDRFRSVNVLRRFAYYNEGSPEEHMAWYLLEYDPGLQSTIRDPRRN